MTHALPRLLAAALLVASLSAAAQEKDSQGGTPTDAGFLKNAGASGLAEVAFSELATKQSTSSQVKDFARTMIQDHGKANDELRSLKSGDRGYSVVDKPLPEAQKALDGMSRLKDGEFDAAYRKQMIADHEEAIAAFEVEIEKGSNPEMKAFAKKTLPTLKHHLEMAKALPTR